MYYIEGGRMSIERMLVLQRRVLTLYTGQCYHYTCKSILYYINYIKYKQSYLFFIILLLKNY